MASCPMPSSQCGLQGQQVVCWLIDTRNLWPGENIKTASRAQDAISLVSIAERETILGKFFARDARMSLASALLKRAFVCYALGVPWQDVRFGRRGDPVHGKPCAVDAFGSPIAGIDFNVSHSGGLVALIGFHSERQPFETTSNAGNGILSAPESLLRPKVLVGVDIVCVNEQDHFQSIESEGFENWIDMYEDIFSASDLWSLKYEIDWFRLEDGTILTLNDIGGWKRCTDCNKRISVHTPGGRAVEFSSRRIVESKLRRFHAWFCCKEAYIKLTGEALLAPWIKQLQFSSVRSPKSAKAGWGEEISDVKVSLQGRQLKNVKMRLQAFEEHYMITSAIQGDIEQDKMPEFGMLNLQKDVLAFAQR